MRAIVVDDEAPARRRLALLLREMGVAVTAMAGTAEEGRRVLERVAVDAAFVDIRLPEVDGLAFGERLRRRGVAVVFVTGFGEFALQAFELGAVDYLLKPVSRDRLGLTLARLTGGRGSPAPALGPPGARAVDRLCLRVDRDRLILPVDGILYVRCDRAGPTVVLDQQSLQARETLERLEDLLGPAGFFRCHRAYLVNLRRVRRIVPWSHDAQSLLLDDPKETLIPLAKSRLRELRSRVLWL